MYRSIAARKIMLLESYTFIYWISLNHRLFFATSFLDTLYHCIVRDIFGMNCAQVHHFRCRQSLARHPRLSRHVSRGVNCHPQHASVTCPLSERASVLFWELLSANQRVSRVVRRTEVSPAIIYLSVPGPGIRETLSLTAGSPSVRTFVRLRAERYLLSARTSTPNTLSG